MRRLTFFFCTLALTAAPGTRADDLPVLGEARRAFTFAVLGDIHYTPPDYKVAGFVHAIAEEIGAQHPETALICQTGDVVEGGVYRTSDGKRRFVRAGYEEMKQQLRFAVDDLARSFRAPVFIAVGNHDKHDPGQKAFRGTALPLLARGLGRPLQRTYYGFYFGNACFVFLDCAPDDYAAQAEFLRGVLTASRKRPGIEHVFVFCHYPLWPVFRPGFSSPRLTDSLLPILRELPPDAYFCSHTHNTVACVRELEGAQITQIQGISNTPGLTLIPIQTRRALLLPAAEIRYCWGYVEGSQTGYYLVSVDGNKVDVQFHVPGQGTVREFAWQEPGKLVDVKAPEPERAAGVTEQALRQVRRAAVVFCPWSEERVKLGVILNGRPVGEVEVAPTHTPFWGETRLSIPSQQLDGLRLANELRFSYPVSATPGVGEARLEVELADGSKLATPVSDRFCFSPGGEARLAEKLKSWRLEVRSMVHESSPGEPLGPIALGFEHPRRIP